MGQASVRLTDRFESRVTASSQGGETMIALYLFVALVAMMFNTAAAFGTTLCTMLGPGLALRGHDGSMDQAVEGLALEYRTSFLLFIAGVFSYYISFILFLAVDYDSEEGWADLLLHVCLLGATWYFVRSTLGTLKRIWKKFRLPPEAIVTGNFDPDGMTPRGQSPELLELEKLCKNKRWQDWPRRQYLYVNVFMDEFLGISNKLFQERYKTMRNKSSTHKGSRRPNNLHLHSIIKYMERPAASCTHAAPSVPSVGSAMPAHGSGADDPATSSTSSTHGAVPVHARSGSPRSRGGFGSWLRRGSEERAGLALSVSSELDPSAMTSLSPSDYLNSGAISPAESGDGI